MIRVFVVIVTYNGMKWIENCLKSISHSSINFETIIIDNASTDGTLEFIQNNYDKCILIESKINLGFAKANNIGMKMALDKAADYVFLLNQDCYIKENTLKDLIDVSQANDQYGILSPIHLNGDGSRVDHNFSYYLGLTRGILDDLILKKVKPIYSTKFINAAAWLITRQCLVKVGGFDTLVFFHYGEDENYAQRTLFHDFKIGIVPAAAICHDRFRNSIRPFNYGRELTRMKINVFDVNLSSLESLKSLIYEQAKLVAYLFIDLFKFSFKIALLRFRLIFHLLHDYVFNYKKSRHININGSTPWLDK
jgi:GT2 family glycosyltransferase